MFVDISKSDQGTATNWVAESGVLDLFFLLGPKPHQVAIPVCSCNGGMCMSITQDEPIQIVLLFADPDLAGFV